ncbi:MAG: DNA translocase FtsK 4TM domain-containing protein [FCB group bacterium]|jgi:S-DNA-T family DNA segregation ATPase FtsK/SpoIIIE
MQLHQKDVVVDKEGKYPIDSGGRPYQNNVPKENISPLKDIPKLYKWQIRIISILLFLFAVLLLLALVSYTPKDEAISDISFKEFFGIFTGNEAIRVKADLAQNWLGLTGAVIAKFFYNLTIGYSIIFLPILILLWSKNLFQKYSITDTTIRKTIFYLLLATLFSVIMASFQNLWYPNIQYQWSGAIGQFIVSLFYKFLGKYGSLFILIASSGLFIILLSKLKAGFIFFPIGNSINKGFIKLKAIVRAKDSDTPKIPKASKVKTEITSDIAMKDDNINVQHSSNSELRTQNSELLEDVEEPVRIIRKNIILDKSRPTFENKSNIISPLGSPFIDIKKVKTFETHSPEIQVNKIKPNQPSNSEFRIQNSELNSPPVSNTFKEDKINNTNWHADDKFSEPINSSEVISTPREIKTKVDYREDSKQIEKMDVIPGQTKDDTSELIEQIHSNVEMQKNFIETDTDLIGVNVPKPLIIEVKETKHEENFIEPIEVLSTSIHDEEIDYVIPPSTILEPPEEENYVDEDELRLNAKLLQEKLETFKIFIENLTVTPGPVVTQYEFVPAAGIKISKIESFADDIAMALKAKGIRIIAPVPGRGTVGIEIPNHKPSTVRFSSVLNSAKFKSNDYTLPLAFGKTISGEVFCTDLAKMPHLLIAGTTGSGKSVGINTVIASLLFKLHPSKLKFVIVDPKKVELRQYGMLENHFLAASPDLNNLIITNPEEAVIVLKAVCAEMDQRYDILKEAGQRNIYDYNEKVKEGKYIHDKEIVHREMPYLVVIIDELADLMLTASKEVEPPIIRIAQLGRAAGIHLVVATQRPSVDVITGIIKANFPARIAYLVASKIDSRTILDDSGAEQLLGNGDMLLLPNGSPKAIRIQNAFISTDEVEELCTFIAKQKGYSQPYMLPSLVEKNTADGIDKEDRDPLFEEAARLIIRHQQGSVSLIQRRLKVGYARAGRIVDELEACGVVGPYDGSKARIVLMESEADLEYLL